MLSIVLSLWQQYMSECQSGDHDIMVLAHKADLGKLFLKGQIVSILTFVGYIRSLSQQLYSATVV